MVEFLDLVKYQGDGNRTIYSSHAKGDYAWWIAPFVEPMKKIGRGYFDLAAKVMHEIIEEDASDNKTIKNLEKGPNNIKVKY